MTTPRPMAYWSFWLATCDMIEDGGGVGIAPSGTALQQLGEVADDVVGPQVGGQGCQFLLARDAGQGEDGPDAEGLGAGDVRFDVVADEDALIRVDVKLVAQFGEKDAVGLAAEDGGDVGGV